MIWICGLPLTIKEVYIRPDYPVRLHPSPVRLIRPRLVKMKTHSTGAFMSFDQDYIFVTKEERHKNNNKGPIEAVHATPSSAHQLKKLHETPCVLHEGNDNLGCRKSSPP
ncbi:hypothetical protein YC2023_015459 [Brassica napus]